MKNTEQTNQKRIYPSQQLVCVLPPTVLKTFMYLLGWQSQNPIKVFVKQIAKATNLNETEVEFAIQTLIDVHLIEIKMVDQQYCAILNAEQAQKFYSVPMSKIMESDGIRISETINWNKTEKKDSSKDIVDMSEQEIKTLILRLQAQLHEHELSKKYIVSNETNDDQLPW